MSNNFKKRLFEGLVICLGALLIAVVFLVATGRNDLFSGGGRAPDRPVDFVVPKHFENYNKVINPTTPTLTVYKSELRGLEPSVFTSKTLVFDAPWIKNYSPAHDNFKIEVIQVDRVSLPTSGPYVVPVAIGLAEIDEITTKVLSAWKRNRSQQADVVFYDVDGKPVGEDFLANVMPERKSRHLKHEYLQKNQCSLKILYNAQNFDHPRHVSSDIYDVQTLATLNTGASWHHVEDNPHNVSHKIGIQHPVTIRWVVDVAHGPLEVKDIPIKKGAEADFGDAMVRVLTDPFEAQSRGWSSMEFYFDENSKRKEKNVSVGLTPQAYDRLITVQFLDGEKKPVLSERNIYRGLGLLSVSEKNDAQYLRVRKYAGVYRFVQDFEMPDTFGAENAEVRDLMDVRIPYLYANRIGDVWDAVRGAVEMQCSMHQVPHTATPTQTEYYNVTPRELIEQHMTLAPPEADLIIDTQEGVIKLEKPKPIIERALEWLEDLF